MWLFALKRPISGGGGNLEYASVRLPPHPHLFPKPQTPHPNGLEVTRTFSLRKSENGTFRICLTGFRTVIICLISTGNSCQPFLP